MRAAGRGCAGRLPQRHEAISPLSPAYSPEASLATHHKPQAMAEPSADSWLAEATVCKIPHATAGTAEQHRSSGAPHGREGYPKRLARLLPLRCCHPRQDSPPHRHRGAIGACGRAVPWRQSKISSEMRVCGRRKPGSDGGGGLGTEQDCGQWIDFAPDRTQVLLALKPTPSRRESALTVIKVLLEEDLATHNGGEHKDARQRHEECRLLHRFRVLSILLF